MKINPTIQEVIKAKVLSEKEDREPSGRLAASRLGQPLQWNMLRYYKVLPKEVDVYTLMKFQRGKDVEDRIMAWLSPEPERMQVPVEYRGVPGIMDLLLEYPVEVKSVTNRAFAHLQKSGPRYGHKLQTELYAKATGHSKYAIAYVASDDYRVLCFEEEVTDEVDTIIDEYEAQVATGTVPVFEAREDWNSSPDYNPYYDWMKLTEEEIAEKLSSMGYAQTAKLL